MKLYGELAKEYREFQERVAIGRVCQCGDCQCCRDYAATREAVRAMMQLANNNPKERT